MELQPHPFLSEVVRLLLEKADRSKGDANVRLKLTSTNAASMFLAPDAESLRLFELLLSELEQTGWVRLHLKKTRNFQSFTEREPTLELVDFAALAGWAKYQSRHEAWDRRFLAHLRSEETQARFGASGPPLADYLARSPMWALEPLERSEAILTLERLHSACRSDETEPLRHLSARIFQGRSKVLDSRSELLRLLGARAEQFPEAPIQLLASMPTRISEVIFVENLLTFETMASERGALWTDALLLYAAGFRGGAKRLLESGGSVVYVREESAAAGAQVVKAFLTEPLGKPVSFFGDLDFSGMDILRNLRQVFPQAEAWRPGYQKLLLLLINGGGHRPEWAEKEGQCDPGATGCAWADHVLLPAVRKSGRFVDQEAVAVA